MSNHLPDSAEVKNTLAALLLYAVRHDCDASMQLLMVNDEAELKLIAHTMAHILGALIVDEHGCQADAEAAVKELIAQLAVS